MMTRAICYHAESACNGYERSLKNGSVPEPIEGEMELVLGVGRLGDCGEWRGRVRRSR